MHNYCIHSGQWLTRSCDISVNIVQCHINVTHHNGCAEQRNDNINNVDDRRSDNHCCSGYVDHDDDGLQSTSNIDLSLDWLWTIRADHGR